MILQKKEMLLFEIWMFILRQNVIMLWKFSLKDVFCLYKVALKLNRRSS